MRFSYLLLPALGLLLQTRGEALVVAGGNGAFNTTNPNPGDPTSGWNNVGWSQNNASVVYLGGGWVITAAHVGNSPISFAGDPNAGALPVYTAIPGTQVTLTNNGAGGQTASTDLILFQINGDPGLPSLNISSVSPTTGSQITAIATGRDRASTLRTWDVNTAPDPDVWSEIPPNPDTANPNLTGYSWDATRMKRWGTNDIPGVSQFENVGTLAIPVNVMAFRTDFSDVGGNESQAALSDSGSGAFRLNGGVWELAGIALAVGSYQGQPASTAVFGNQTYYADLSFYRSQILAVIPEPGGAALSIMGLLGLLRRRRA